MILQDRENRLQIADDPADVRYDVLRKKDAIDRASAHTHAQCFCVESAVERQQSADSDQSETKSKLEGNKLCRDQDQHRESLTLIR